MMNGQWVMTVFKDNLQQGAHVIYPSLAEAIKTAREMGALCPSIRDMGDTYRNFAYVEEECKSLAKQLKAVTHA